MAYEMTVGLEIHVELATKSKMFCSCKNLPAQAGDPVEPNINVCPICMAHPGTLPTINEEAIRQLIRVGLALNCEIPENSKFDRKSYFYPDLPKGYQISQYDMPICKDGGMKIGEHVIRLERIHMEEDAGTLKHEGNGTLVDYNRAGMPLMELVTKPDIRSSDQIAKFAKELQLILRYLGASDADIEKGQMRVEVNISLNMGTKVEVKNIGSISAAVKAAEYEYKRQVEAIEKGEKIIQETRGWDDEKEITVSQRVKEGSADYRYFPEPDLPPMRFTEKMVEEIRATLPELPQQRRDRFLRQYGLTESQIEIFTVTKEFGDFFEEVASELGEPRLYTLAANYIVTEQPSNINPENFAELIKKISRKELSSTAAKIVLDEMAVSGRDPDEIMKEKDLGQISDAGDLANDVDEVISANSKAVEDYKKGKVESLKFLVGKIMAATKGKANPEVIMDLLKQKLAS
ncbi:MAG: Asp-tRNA(Asn)/Glu-tRNA(Gln) amidotransferase subunit GatB [Patescibacteria group bacterium]